MRNLFLLTAIIFMFFVAYNIDFIEHRRSHIKRSNPKNNYTGWSKGTEHNHLQLRLLSKQAPDYTKGFSPVFIRLRDEI